MGECYKFYWLFDNFSGVAFLSFRRNLYLLRFAFFIENTQERDAD